MFESKTSDSTRKSLAMSWLNIFVFCFLSTSFVYAKKKCIVVLDRGDEYIECKDVTSLSVILEEWETGWQSLRIINQPHNKLIITDLPRANFLYSLKELDLSGAGHIRITENGFREYDSLMTLNLSSTGLEEIHSFWFPKKLRTLDLSRNNFISPMAEYFRELGRLNHLSLASNSISSLADDLFTRHARLISLDLSLNEFQKVKDVGNIPSLKRLKITDNMINKIEKDDFTDLPKLEVLDASFNIIKEIEEGAFSNLQQLEKLDLSSNTIATVPPSLFSDGANRKLKTLLLRGNLIRSLESEGFHSLSNLMTLDLSGNALEELNKASFVGLDSLKYLNLSNNRILNIQPPAFEAFPSLQVLDLSGNRLQTLDGNIFGTAGLNVREFLLSRNNLGVLQPHLFEPIRNVRIVDVSHNKLSYFDENVFPPLEKINKLFLSNNSIIDLPLKANDLFRSLTEFAIDNNKLTFLRITETAARRLRKMTFQDNPWQCLCLDEIINFAASRKIDYGGGQYFDGDKPVCLQTKFSTCIKDIQKVKEQRFVELFESN